MEVRFLDVAQQELDEAVEYYNNESKGLQGFWLGLVEGSTLVHYKISYIVAELSPVQNLLTPYWERPNIQPFL